MTLRDLLSTLQPTTVMATVVDNDAKEVVLIKTAGYDNLEDNIESAEVLSWTIKAQNQIQIKVDMSGVGPTPTPTSTFRGAGFIGGHSQVLYNTIERGKQPNPEGSTSQATITPVVLEEDKWIELNCINMFNEDTEFFIEVYDGDESLLYRRKHKVAGSSQYSFPVIPVKAGQSVSLYISGQDGCINSCEGALVTYDMIYDEE